MNSPEIIAEPRSVMSERGSPTFCSAWHRPWTSFFGALVGVPLGMAQEPRAVVDEADQEGLQVLTAAGQDLREPMEVQMHQNARPRILMVVGSSAICGMR